MSQAYLVIGVPLSDVYKQETTKKSVTRYNERTGDPYQTEEEEVAYTFCGKEVDPDEDADSLCQRHGLQSFTGGWSGSGDNGPTICGIDLYSVADCNSSGGVLEQVQPSVVSSTTKRVKEYLKAAGYEGSVRMYLIMRESY